ncbi:uncharacterized protein EKO05_0006966 [Ascochyta rabiei]|uniref:Uncharacterized protein n=1 Tax=Didymella rabiei TaxID=5454 RepID=A0A162YZS4_DIDRA|nr:uncharacterized protein EKO05_0006966 [Ascochyta rabiei]KZM20320.1 hypothetical protein ST47_g8469 [Ascochyta rabiei]UPX16574.1 hypothetical protein EKO05_0006966 [Ascochyta rabiei]
MTTLDELREQGATSFAIYEDQEYREPLSPSAMFEGDTSFNSDLAMSMNGDEVPNIEVERELGDGLLQPYQSSYTSRKGHSRRQSATTHYSFISAMPSETGSISSKPASAGDPAMDARYTPRKERPRFRNPESVRAMQMSSPLPMSAYESNRERMKSAYGLATPSRTGRSETPVSRHSGSRRGSVRSHHSPKPPPTPQQAPLVLLHVTILPMQLPFSHDLMARIMPDWLVENYKLLEEKLQDIILMRRGLLIPHPRDEYELLEERILESLELKTPRLLKCGHFVAPDDDADKDEDDDSAIGADDGSSRMSGGTMTDDHEGMHTRRDSATCLDCHRELKKPGQGVGAGTRRFDIRIYAANGLMRSEAWTAAWTEMERCDVEISPWIPEDVRKTLEKRILEEQEADKRKAAYNAELQRRVQEDAIRQQKLAAEAIAKKRQEEAELQRSFEAAAAALQRSIDEKAADKARFEETMEEKIEEAKEEIRLELESQAMLESNSVAERFRAMEEALRQYQYASCVESVAPSEASPHSRASTYDLDLRSVSRGRRGYTSSRPHAAQLPLSTLLKNYMMVQLADPKNWAILLLTAAVGFMSMNATTHLPPTPSISDVSSVDVVSASAVTATTTAFSTLTITETQMASSVYPTTSYLSSAYATVPSSSVAESVLPTILPAEPEVIADPNEVHVFESSSTVDDEPLRRASESSEEDSEETVVAEPVVEDLTEPANIDSSLFQHTSELLEAASEEAIVIEDPVTPQAEDSSIETDDVAAAETDSVAIESDEEMEVCAVEDTVHAFDSTCPADKE